MSVKVESSNLLGCGAMLCGSWCLKGLWCRCFKDQGFKNLGGAMFLRRVLDRPLKLMAPWSFGMPGTTWLTTWCHIPEDLNPQQYYYENLKFSVSVKSALLGWDSMYSDSQVPVCLAVTLHYVNRFKTFYIGRMVPVHILECGSLQNHCVAIYCIDSTCLSVPFDVKLY
jgi:hypothetical protein